MSKDRLKSDVEIRAQKNSANLEEDAKKKIVADKAKLKKDAEEKQAKVNAEAKAKLEIEKEEKAAAKIAEEKAKIVAEKTAKEAVARAKKAKADAVIAQAEADIALAALKGTQVKAIVMKKEIQLTVTVPGHSEINTLKKFTVGEKVTRLAFIRLVMGCGMAEYEIVEKG